MAASQCSVVRLAGGRRLGLRRWPGEGDPLVLLHGLLDSADGWSDLARHTRRPFLAFDLAGFGRSDHPERPEISAYRYRERELGRELSELGQFGENFTVEGLPDDEVCIGDRFAIGSALFEVSQPRMTCFTVGIRLDEPRMLALLTGHGRPGPLPSGPAFTFSRSSVTVRFGDRWCSLLELAEECDVPADWSCRTGVCHRCESGLVAGTIDYDPEPSIRPPTATRCCAARARRATSRSTCDAEVGYAGVRSAAARSSTTS